MENKKTLNQIDDIYWEVNRYVKDIDKKLIKKMIKLANLIHWNEKLYWI